MREYTLEELVQAVQAWCEDHQISPANGQAAEDITERTIRYYRTLGLLDSPLGGYIKHFTDKHRLQLIAIRLYQAQGLPLRKIRDELYGQSLEQLRQLEKTAGMGGKPRLPAFAPAPNAESWSVLPIDEEFMLISRQNRPVPRAVIQKIRDLLAPLNQATARKIDTAKN